MPDTAPSAVSFVCCLVEDVASELSFGSSTDWVSRCFQRSLLKSAGLVLHLGSVGVVLAGVGWMPSAAIAQMDSTSPLEELRPSESRDVEIFSDPTSPTPPRLPSLLPPPPPAPPESPISSPIPIPRPEPGLPVEPERAIDPLDAYRLGNADQIQLDIFDVPEFSGADGQHTIMVDGSINLPWIGQTVIAGLTIREAEVYLEELYAPFINNPIIVITLIAPRPLRVAVVGEVNRPGSYTIDPIDGVGNDLGEGISQWTTVVQAIQQAGGITQLADIRNIQIRRPQPFQEQDTVIDIDLWRFLGEGDLQQDVTLRDGDTVLVPTVTEFNPAESQDLAEANFSPEFITAYVVGEVENPGELQLRPNTSLTQAILAAGGYEDDRAGRAELIRVNPDGSVTRQRISVSFSDDLDEEENPPLRNNDIIFVRRSTVATAFDILDFVIAPVRNVLGLVDIVRDIFDNPDDNNNQDDLDDEIRRREDLNPPAPLTVPTE